MASILARSFHRNRLDRLWFQREGVRKHHHRTKYHGRVHEHSAGAIYEHRTVHDHVDAEHDHHINKHNDQHCGDDCAGSVLAEPNSYGAHFSAG